MVDWCELQNNVERKERVKKECKKLKLMNYNQMAINRPNRYSVISILLSFNAI